MMRAGQLPVLKDEQRAATAPDRHIWLSASAGTGKTQVLVARILRLLLQDGVAPGHLLALTFTKAGAAEMVRRLGDRLALWVRADDNWLRRELTAIGANANDPQLLQRARELFARVLDTPGGIRIQTIHAFCQSLLASFPLEAGMAPGFRAIEGREANMLSRRTLAELLVDAEHGGDHRLIAGVEALSRRYGADGAETYLIKAARCRDALAALGDDPAAVLRRMLGLGEGPVAAALAPIVADGGALAALLCDAAAANRRWNTPSGIACAETIGEWLASDVASRVATIESVHGLFVTKVGEPRSARYIIKVAPDYAEIRDAAAQLTTRIVDALALAELAEQLGAMLYAAARYADAWHEAKRREGVAEFDDLIARTIHLLGTPGIADWIRYMLDQRIDHILIDEAQDTNAEQWHIIRALAEEFFAGEGARGDRIRTIFAVGDFKQAIFGFQGSDPRAFNAARSYFERHAEGVGHDFERLGLDQSFRSTRPVLDAVDAVFAELGGAAIGLADEAIRHNTMLAGAGSVTLWRPVRHAADDGDGDDDGGDGGDEAGDDGDAGPENWADAAMRRFAGGVAEQIAGWSKGGLTVTGEDGRPRPSRAGDIMVLVRSRGDLVPLLVARLHQQRVKVAGVDRLLLNSPLAVRDLLAAVRFVLQPADDLTLAALLVSPLIGWSQDELYERARQRGKTSLWQHLGAHKPAALGDLLALADLVTPYRFLEHILSGPMQGRQRLLARLGEEARDPVEELLSAALLFERRHGPSLQGFVDWFDTGDVEIVRDPAAAGDAVRIMTAHAAKGLEAPIVVLADATKNPERLRADPIMFDIGAQTKLELPPLAKPQRLGPLADAHDAVRARAIEEHWRLLYVAMTRARQHLFVGGWLTSKDKGVVAEKSWYAAVDKGLARAGVQPDPNPGSHVLRILSDHGRGRPPLVASVAAIEPSPRVLPEWANQPAPAEARPPRPLAPSSLGIDKEAEPPASPAMRVAAERGRLLHGLFERLPAVDPVQRRAVGLRWLASTTAGLDPAMQSAMIDDVLAVINAPEFAAIFAPGALAEAPLAAVVNGVVIAGTVDRLLIGERTVLAIDYKTGRRAPQSLADVTPSHLAQMAAYVHALRVIFPDHLVSGGLLYTAAPRLIMLDAAAIDSHKPGYPEQQN